MSGDGSRWAFLTREAPRPAWLRDSPMAPWAAVGSVCLGAFMGQLDASIVTLTYPALQREFATSLGAVEWVSLSYLVVLAALLVPVGRWADTRGRKLLYLYGFVLFTLASAGCAVAPTMAVLVVARAIQAVGAALLQANSVALVVLSVPREKMRAALGLQAGGQSLGLALGPTLGGVLVAGFGWRAVFWVNVPVGIIAVVTGYFLLPRSRNLRARTGRDPVGFVTLATALVLALLALSGFAGLGLPVAASAALLAVAAVAAAGLRWVEHRSPAPLVDMTLLRRGGVGSGLVGAMLAYLVLFAPLVLYPLVFGDWHVGTTTGGLVLSCLPIGFAVAAIGANLVGLPMGNATRVACGGVGAAVALLAAIPVWQHPGAVAGLLVALGVFMGLAIPANNAAVMGAVPATSTAVTGGMVNVARALGTSLGVAITAIVVHVAQQNHTGPPPLALAILAVCALGLAATAIGRRGARGGVSGARGSGGTDGDMRGKESGGHG